MEPVSLTAGAIATLIFSKALEKGGEQLGEVAFDRIGKLLNVIREKFKSKGMEGILTQAQDNPTETNKSVFKTVLETQMEDKAFAQKLKELMDELESDKQVKQIFFKNVNVKSDVEIGDVEQTTTRDGSVTQEAFTEVEAGGKIKIANVKQQS